MSSSYSIQFIKSKIKRYVVVTLHLHKFKQIKHVKFKLHYNFPLKMHLKGQQRKRLKIGTSGFCALRLRNH